MEYMTAALIINLTASGLNTLGPLYHVMVPNHVESHRCRNAQRRGSTQSNELLLPVEKRNTWRYLIRVYLILCFPLSSGPLPATLDPFLPRHQYSGPWQARISTGSFCNDHNTNSPSQLPHPLHRTLLGAILLYFYTSFSLLFVL
jgi:hypothetical protein